MNSTVKEFEIPVDEKKDSKSLRVFWKTDAVQHTLALSYTALFFMYLSTKFFKPELFDKEVFNDLLNVAMLIYSFYFGSSYRPSRL